MIHFIGTGKDAEADSLQYIHEVSMTGDDVQIVAARIMKVVMPAVIQSIKGELNELQVKIHKNPINFVMGAILANANIAGNYIINFCPEMLLQDESEVVVDAMANQFRACLEQYIQVAKAKRGGADEPSQ